MNVLQFPLCRICVLFIAGIWSAQFMIESKLLLWTAGILVIFLLLAILLVKRSFVFGYCCSALAFLCGAFCLYLNTEKHYVSHYLHEVRPQKQLLQLAIKERLKPGAKFDRYICELESLDGKPISGNILLHTKKQDKPFIVGTRIKLFEKINPLTYVETFGFNYDRYLANKNIYAKVYISTTVYLKLLGPKKDAYYFADAVRVKILSNLIKSGIDKRELAVLNALILGQQQDIDPTVLKEYQYAGAVHILSVSGLHVGFILVFLEFFLKRLPNTRYFAFLKIIVLLVSLWGFAFIAGLSPSVVRAVTMFSFVAIGLHLKKSTNIFHTLMVSMLLILLVRPQFIFDVGFQLSYLALFFIVWLQPMLSELYRPKYRTTQYFWNILTVSFAAQIGTFPLSVYYFHQFPGLFFVTNLLVLPLLSFIMAIGVLATVWALFSPIPYVLTVITENSIRLLNVIVSKVASAEAFLIKDLTFTLGLMLLTYALIVFFIRYFKNPTFSTLRFVLFSLLCLQMQQIYNARQIQSVNELVVFSQRGQSLIGIRNGQQMKLLHSGKDFVSSFSFSNYKLQHQIESLEKKPLVNFAFFADRSIHIIDSTGAYLNKRTDILMLTQSPKINFDRLLVQTSPRIVIADATNYSNVIQHWKRSCKKLKIPFHATAEKGFYRISD